MNSWTAKELSTVGLGDKRLEDRMQLILQRLSQSPDKSIKSSFKGWSEVMGAYRFFNNEKTSVDNVLKPHQDATVERVKAFDRVLIIQDTTELDYTRKKHLNGAGPLTADRKGFFAHNQFVITPERVPLGTWATTFYTHDEATFGKSADKRKHLPIEDKQSYRWLLGYRDACRLKQLTGEVEVIACGDRENDIYEVYQEWRQLRDQGRPYAQWLIRCCQNRAIIKEKSCQADSLYPNIREKVCASELLGEFTIEIKEKVQKKKIKGKKINTLRVGRQAHMQVSATQATLRPPYRKDKKLSEVPISIVMVNEKHPPEGQDPIEWVLFTSLEVTDFQSALDLVRLYAARWEIEVFHRVLKTGCKIEELQLKTDDRIQVAIALYMIVAWRVMQIMHLSRQCPELPCDVIFEKDEWQAFWIIVKDGQSNALANIPKLGEFVRKIAEFGGFLGRKGDGDPGPQAIWQGLAQLRTFTIAWQAYGKNLAFP